MARRKAHYVRNRKTLREKKMEQVREILGKRKFKRRDGSHKYRISCRMCGLYFGTVMVENRSFGHPWWVLCEVHVDGRKMDDWVPVRAPNGRKLYYLKSRWANATDEEFWKRWKT